VSGAVVAVSRSPGHTFSKRPEVVYRPKYLGLAMLAIVLVAAISLVVYAFRRYVRRSS
jgi:hypothetical protein